MPACRVKKCVGCQHPHLPGRGERKFLCQQCVQKMGKA